MRHPKTPKSAKVQSESGHTPRIVESVVANPKTTVAKRGSNGFRFPKNTGKTGENWLRSVKTRLPERHGARLIHTRAIAATRHIGINRAADTRIQLRLARQIIKMPKLG